MVRLGGLPYFFSWYLDVVSPGWHALVKEDYSVLFPVTVKNRFFIDYVVQPKFSAQLGMLGGTDTDWEWISTWIQKYYFSIRIALNTNQPEQIAKPDGFVGVTYRMKLDKDAETLFAEMTSHHRQNVRKAIRGEVEVIPTNALTVGNFFKTNKGKELKLGDSFYTTWLKLASEMEKRGAVYHVAAIRKGAILSAASFVVYNGWLIYLLASSSKVGRKYSANHALIWSQISRFAGSGLEFDFEGSSIPELARFYAGFGAKSYSFPRFHITKFRIPFINT